MSSSKPEAPTALIYSGKTPEGFLSFDRQVKRWLRRRCKGLTKYFWEGEAPTIDAENYAALCKEIYTSLLKTNPSYAAKCWKKQSEYSVEKCQGWFDEMLEDLADYLDEHTSDDANKEVVDAVAP